MLDEPFQSGTDPITVRPAATVEDYLACQDVQRRAWGIAEENYVVPVATMVGAQLHGGLVLGAFLPGGEAVGMSFAFLGRVEGRLCLYSQLTGVVPGYQGRDIGHRIKLAQREFARATSVPCIAWAFDPLQAGNARFNLDKLGATVGRYVENMYGPRSDALNRDTPTDRLIAVWETDPSGPGRLPLDAPGDLPRLIVTDGPEGPRFAGLSDDRSRSLLEIPEAISRLRAEAPDLAGAWGSAVRQAFLAAFAAGYRAVGFVREGAGDSRRGYYVLEREPLAR
jgi:predicted GNAT superfamily acetyltransferase